MSRHSPTEIERLKRIAAGKEFGKPSMRWKMMDVAFADNILRPRRLIIEVKPQYYPNLCYTGLSEIGGVGSHGEHALKTLDEWLAWIEKFRDEKTGREMREAIEAAKAPFVEPSTWGEFRKRYAETGNPFID